MPNSDGSLTIAIARYTLEMVNVTSYYVHPDADSAVVLAMFEGITRPVYREVHVKVAAGVRNLLYDIH